MTYFAKPGGVIDKSASSFCRKQRVSKDPADLTGWCHDTQVWEMPVLRKG